MRVFKTKRLDRWASKEGLADKVLWQAALEVAAGNVEASLGQCLYKKRLARPGEGKRSGLRTIVAFKSASGDRMFFVYGFAKNQQANITDTERHGLALVARHFLDAAPTVLDNLLRAGELVEVIKETGHERHS